MTAWDFASSITNQFSSVTLSLLTIIVVVLCIVGFCRHGVDFIRHGFSQNFLNELLDKLATKEDIKELETRLDKVETEMGNMKTELSTIKVNHFGHLKDFLTELTSVLLDKGVIINTDKTRLDNKLRGM